MENTWIRYILIVPFGPRFVLKTSCNPLAALVLIARAWAALATSALGFNALIAAMMTWLSSAEIYTVTWKHVDQWKMLDCLVQSAQKLSFTSMKTCWSRRLEGTSEMINWYYTRQVVNNFFLQPHNFLFHRASGQVISNSWDHWNWVIK